METLKDEHHMERETDPSRALLRLPEGNFDLMIVSLSLEHADGLRLCSQVRSLERTRHLPIMIVIEPGDDAKLLRGLDMGVKLKRADQALYCAKRDGRNRVVADAA